jgi:hypothetical protein
MTHQDQLVSKLWEPEYRDGKTVVILAGYTQQMQEMLRGNPGMASRFPTTLTFEDWTNGTMIDLILANAADPKIVGPTQFVFEDGACAALEATLQQLRACPDFGNARDAENLLRLTIESRDVRVGSDPNQLRTSPDGKLLLMRDDVIEAARQMLSSRGGVCEGHQYPVPAHDTQILKLVFAELQQQFEDSVDLSAALSLMLADGITDVSIIRSSNVHNVVARFLPEHVTIQFIETFTQFYLPSKKVNALEIISPAFDAVFDFAADITIAVGFLVSSSLPYDLFLFCSSC